MIDENRIKLLQDILGDDLKIKKVINYRVYNISPSENNKNSREIEYPKFIDRISNLENISNVNPYMGPGAPVYESSDTTPIVEFDLEKDGELFHYRLQFKPNSKHTPSETTKNQEVFTIKFLIYVLTESAGKGELSSDYEFTSNQLAEIEELGIEGYESQFIGVAKAVKKLIGGGNYILSHGSYNSSEGPNIFNLIKGTGTGLQAKKKNIFKDLSSDVYIKTDSWNPSDIYISREDLINPFIEDWNEAINDPDSNLETFLSILESYMFWDGKIGIAGVSLKKLITLPPYDVEFLGYNQVPELDEIENKNFSFDGILNIPTFADYIPRKNIKELNYHIGLKNKIYKWQYRSKNASLNDNLQLMSSENGKGHSRGTVPKYLIYKEFQKYNLLPLSPVENSQYSLRDFISVIRLAEETGFSLRQKSGKILDELDFLNYCDLIEGKINNGDETAKAWSGRLIGLIKFAMLLCMSKKSGELNELLNLFENSKSDNNVAPYIKIS